MAFEIPNLDEEHELLLGLARHLFASLNGGKGLNLSKGSFWWLFFRTLAGAVTDNHANLASLVAELLPDGSLGELLDRWGVIRGVVRKSATPARKSVALRVFGTATSPVNAGEQLKHTSGLIFEITRTDLVGPGNYVDVDLKCTTGGAATRLSAGEHLAFLSTPAPLAEDAILELDLDEGGEDREADGPYRARILNRFSNPPRGGTRNDYEQWALELPDIAAAYAYRNRAGVGTVDLTALHAGSGGDRIPTLPELAVVQAYIDTKRPCSVKDFRVLQTVAHEVDVDLTYLTDGAAEHAPDWDDTGAWTVSSYTALTRTLVFTGGARPPTIKAGDRMLVKPVAGGGTGVQRVVEALGAGLDDVILEADPVEADPAALDTIYAGGALVDGVRVAVIALFNSLGTANPDAVNYGPWEGNLDPGALETAARGVVGVKRATAIAPAALVEAADPAGTLDDGTVELLIPRRILVRAAH